MKVLTFTFETFNLFLKIISNWILPLKDDCCFTRCTSRIGSWTTSFSNRYASVWLDHSMSWGLFTPRPIFSEKIWCDKYFNWNNISFWYVYSNLKFLQRALFHCTGQPVRFTHLVTCLKLLRLHTVQYNYDWVAFTVRCLLSNRE